MGMVLDSHNASRYYHAMIKNCRDKETEKVWNRRVSRKLPSSLQRAAQIKLRLLEAAESLEELRVPPGNRLEALKGDRRGQYSIRINAQWRVCFRWRDGWAEDVEITDYHD